MNWGLAQGMLGRGRTALAPSALAVGPNTYLSQGDFLKMMGVAFSAHMIIFIIASMVPQEKVVTIPVRALSFKLGDGDRVSAVGMTMNAAPAPVAAPAMKATSGAETWRATPNSPAPKVPAPLRPIARPAAAPHPQPAPVPVKAPKLVPVEQPVVVQRQMPAENKEAAQPVPATPAPTPAAAPVPEPTPAPQAQQAAPAAPPAPAATPPVETLPPSNLPSTAALTQSSNAGPQQYVREAGVPVAELTKTGGGTSESPQEIRERYEQQISGWVGRHKLYPPEAHGREGRVVVRMRIDRTGYVRYYAIEQSSGNAPIDAAAIDMVRRANPMPAVPENYPSGSLIEFLIPITFHAPR